MNIQHLTLLCFLCLFSQVSFATSSCTDAYTSASYGLSHSKKSLKAYNFDHQQYYAGRALEALEKTRDLLGDCGCDSALEAISDGIENLEKALDPEDWDMGRYFSKRAVADAYTILEQLDLCATESPSGSVTVEEIQVLSEESAKMEADLIHQKEVLAKSIHKEAVESLKQLRQHILGLTNLLDCGHAKDLLEAWPELEEWKGSFSRPEAVRAHYAQETEKMYKRALKAVKACREN